MEEPITIVLADDHALLRNMLASKLNAEPDMKVVASVADARSAALEAARHRPRIVVTDIDMPGVQCFAAARQIRIDSPNTRIIFLSAFLYDRYIHQALEVEAWGYLTKNEPPDEVVKAVRDVARSVTFFSPEVRSRIIFDSKGPRLAEARSSRASSLTAREVEVLQYLAQGLSKKEISSLMFVSAKTVDNHVTHIMNKLDIHDRVELTRFAIREGISEP